MTHCHCIFARMWLALNPARAPGGTCWHSLSGTLHTGTIKTRKIFAGSFFFSGRATIARAQVLLAPTAGHKLQLHRESVAAAR